jgi:hypothetical protein
LLTEPNKRSVSASFVGRSLAQQHAAIAQGRSEAYSPIGELIVRGEI